MQLFTLGDVLTLLDRELDLNSDDPISRQEKVGYINRAIEEAESGIHKLGCEDQYFRASQALPLSTGQRAYALPTNMYANKILRLVYAVGTNIYEIKRIRRVQTQPIELQLAEINQYGQDQDYQYLLKNDSVSFGPELWLYPLTRETDATAVTLWYIRQANPVSVDSDIIDIPQFMSFVLQFARVKCMRKIYMGNVPQEEIDELERQRENMLTTLREQVPDENNLIDQDTTFYYEFDNYWGQGGCF